MDGITREVNEMDCPKCDEYMDKTEILDWNPEGGHRITVTWQAVCPYCEYETMIEEEFESTGWEKEIE